MSNIDIARKFFSSLEAGDYKTLESILADDFVFNHKAAPKPMGKKEFIHVMKAIHAAMPDWSFNTSQWQDGNPVRATANITASHKKTLDLSHIDLPVVPATQKKIKLPSEPAIIEIEGGRIRRHEVEAIPGGGIPGILGQLGVKIPGARPEQHV